MKQNKVLKNNDSIEVTSGHKRGRYYGKKKYPSVTTVIGKYYYNPTLQKWKQDVGHEESQRISNAASSLGTKVHKLNEIAFSRVEGEYTGALQNYEPEVIQRHNIFKPLLSQLSPILLEKKLIWEDISPSNPSQVYGFGGTADIVAAIDPRLELFEDKNCTIPYTYFASSSSPVYIIGDYKNWKSPKYPKQLVNVYLQLSAYCALVNRATSDFYTVRDAFIMGSSSKQLYLYHLGTKELNWYWSWFKQILGNYFNIVDPSIKTFKWSLFEQYSLGALRVYNPETEAYESQILDENFLAKRIYLKDASPEQCDLSGDCR
jgi:hypothetical protein